MTGASLRQTSCAEKLDRSVHVCELPRVASDHRRGHGTCHDPLADTNALHLGVHGWMDVHACMHRFAGNHGCSAYRASTDLRPTDNDIEAVQKPRRRGGLG